MGVMIDREAIHRKYAEERAKRLRSDGISQFSELTGKFAFLEGDPFTVRAERAPIAEHTELLIVGGGFAGLQVAARIKEAGSIDFRIIDGGGDFGGVWYWNRYPGAMCDTTSLVYLPMLEETGYRPSMKYVHGPEIRAHAMRIARRFDLYPHAIFSTNVTSMTWSDEGNHWIVETDRGDRLTATYVTMGTGPLNRPKLPGVPGIDTFTGKSFHTARWDYSATGGSEDGAPMTELADKRVGIIGTGATGVQVVPALGRDSGELYVFQRTPSSIAPRNNAPIDPAWYATLEPNWQTKYIRNFGELFSTGYAEEDFLQDGFCNIMIGIYERMMADALDPLTVTADDFVRAYHASDDEKMVQLRARVSDIVEDPETAEGLKAWYRQFCKRPCFHDEYLPTFNRPNVHLVDTNGRGVERVDETGVWANGQHYDLDVIVYASGFEFNSDYTRRSSFEAYGREGLTLTEKWADGLQTYQGMHVRGFPNMFILGFWQGESNGANVTSNYRFTGRTLANIIAHARAKGARQVEASEQAERDWMQAIDDFEVPTILGGTDCTPGYYNNEGQVEGRKEKRNMAAYPEGIVAFSDYIQEWRSNGLFEGLEFRSGPPGSDAPSA